MAAKVRNRITNKEQGISNIEQFKVEGLGWRSFLVWGLYLGMNKRMFNFQVLECRFS
jgi:hypothetical protein